VQGAGKIEPVQGDELLAGFVQSDQGGSFARGHKAPQIGQGLAAGHFALGHPQTFP